LKTILTVFGAKFRWEHTPEWALTSKLLISKHQQVQLLEAASILVSMFPEDQVEEDSIQDGSDLSSASPAASAFSDTASTTNTTPPPQTEQTDIFVTSGRRGSRNSALGFGNKQTSMSQAIAASAPSASSGFAHFAQTPPRPFAVHNDEETSLAAAVELLSCSFGTPKTGPLSHHDEIPPVPPLPERFLKEDLGSTSMSGSTATPTAYGSYALRTSLPNHKEEEEEGEQDMDMDDKDKDNVTERSEEPHHHIHSIEEEEGVFGKMEE
jgi:hypothetical protein